MTQGASEVFEGTQGAATMPPAGFQAEYQRIQDSLKLKPATTDNGNNNGGDVPTVGSVIANAITGVAQEANNGNFESAKKYIPHQTLYRSELKAGACIDLNTGDTLHVGRDGSQTVVTPDGGKLTMDANASPSPRNQPDNPSGDRSPIQAPLSGEEESGIIRN